jgi:hypothetical protein
MHFKDLTSGTFMSPNVSFKVPTPVTKNTLEGPSGTTPASALAWEVGPAEWTLGLEFRQVPAA